MALPHFKNLRILRLVDDCRIDADALNAALAKMPFAPTASTEKSRHGFCSPLSVGSSHDYVHQQGGHLLIQLMIETRNLPAAVVRDEVEKRATKIFEETGSPVGRKARRDLKDQVTSELLAKAFTMRKTVRAWIDLNTGWVGLDTPGGGGDSLLEALIQVLDTPCITSWHTELSPTGAMADWLAGGEAPASFTIDRDCELRAIDVEKPAVRYSRHNLDTPEIREHLASGKQPRLLGLTFDNRISFVLTEAGHLKRIALLDVLAEKIETSIEESESIQHATFALMAGELPPLLTALETALGGRKVIQA